MNDQDWLAERFEANRSHLRGVAYRMLGSADRGRRRRPGGLDPPEPDRHERRREPARVADDGRRAGLPQHAAIAQDAPRGVPRDPRPGSRREPGGRDRSRAGGAAGRLGRARPARRPRLADAAPSGSRSCSTTSSPCRSTRSRRSSAGRRRRRGSSRAGPVAASRARPCRTSTSMASGPSSTRSSPRPATATSNASSRSSTRTSCVRSDGGVARPELVSLVRGAQAVAEQAMTFRRFAETSTRVLVNGLPGGIAWSPDGSPFAVLALTVKGGRIVGDRRARRSRPARPAGPRPWSPAEIRPVRRPVTSAPSLGSLVWHQTIRRRRSTPMTARTTDAARVPRLVTVLQPDRQGRSWRPACPLGFNGLLTIRGRTSGLPRTTPVAIIDVSRPALGLGPVGRRPLGPQPARRGPRDDHRPPPEGGRQRDRARPDPAASRSSATSWARSRAGIPFGVRFIRIVDGVDLDDPVEAAEGRPVFELAARSLTAGPGRPRGRPDSGPSAPHDRCRRRRRRRARGRRRCPATRCRRRSGPCPTRATASITAPRTPPAIVPIPPENDVPPMTAAAMTCSSTPVPRADVAAFSRAEVTAAAIAASMPIGDERLHDRQPRVDAGRGPPPPGCRRSSRRTGRTGAESRGTS